MVVTSGYRCQDYNDEIGGAKFSKHVSGIACDIAVGSSADRYDLIYCALMSDFTGIGVAKDFIHLDIRDDAPVLFTYDPR